MQSVKFQVQSQEEAARSQPEVVSSQQEENQTAKGSGSLESGVQSPESENYTSSPSLIQTLDAGRQTPDASAPRRSVFSNRFVWLGSVLLVAGTLGALWYLFLPLPSTQHLTPSTQELPLPDKPSLAVMPFTNLSGDPEQEYFSDGLTDDLITALSRLSALLVIARHSVFTYKGKAVKVQDVSEAEGLRMTCL